MQEGQYDLDQQANGVCTFGFFCLEVCGSLVESVVVPVGQSRLVERGNCPPRLPKPRIFLTTALSASYMAPERNVGIGKSGRVRRGVGGV